MLLFLRLQQRLLGLQAETHVVEGIADFDELVASPDRDLNAQFAGGDALGIHPQPAQRGHDDLREQ